MTTTMLNKHGESLSISSKYVSSSSIFKPNSVGERGTDLFNTNTGYYFIMCLTIYSNFCLDYGVYGFYILL